VSSTEEIKVCRACAETIKAAARLCPFCQTRQFGFPFWHLVGTVPVVIVGIVCLATANWLLSDAGKEKCDSFGLHRHELVIRGTRAEQARQTPESWMRSLGTNEFKRQWSVHQIEVRFLDPQGSPLDNRLPDSPDYGVQPCYWLIGFITNAGRFAWSVNELEARPVDTQGNLLGEQTFYFPHSLLVPPGKEQAFRAYFFDPRFTNDILLRQIQVREARSPDAIPDTRE